MKSRMWLMAWLLLVILFAGVWLVALIGGHVLVINAAMEGRWLAAALAEVGVLIFLVVAGAAMLKAVEAVLEEHDKARRREIDQRVLGR